MEPPDKRLFDSDLDSAEFRNGVVKGWWDLADAEILPSGLTWPRAILWIAPAPRADAPSRFYVSLDVAGYRTVPPTGAFWDPAANAPLDVARRPKGRDGSRVAKVFRTDWEGGRAFYHPYDRVAAQGHAAWPAEQPHLRWTANHTIVDYLMEFHGLLNSGDYVGI